MMVQFVIALPGRLYCLFVTFDCRISQGYIEHVRVQTQFISINARSNCACDQMSENILRQLTLISRAAPRLEIQEGDLRADASC
jgi:hypothetical protein